MTPCRRVLIQGGHVRCRNRRCGSARVVSSRAGRPATSAPPGSSRRGRHAQRLHDILLDEDDARAAVLDARQRRIDVAHDAWREAEADFVAEQQPRIGHQRAADGRHLLLAPRQHAAGDLAALAQSREEIVDGGERPLAFDGARRIAPMSRFSSTAERRKEPASLRHERDTAAHDVGGVAMADRLAVEDDARGWPGEQPGDGLQERRLAGAVGADDGDRLAGLEPTCRCRRAPGSRRRKRSGRGSRGAPSPSPQAAMPI